MKAKLPLFIITGASGAGKTTVMHELREQMPEFVLFSTDNDNFGTTAEKLEYQDRYNVLLHCAHAVRWLLEHADTDDPPMPTFDSTSTPPSRVAEQIKDYIMLKWNGRVVSTEA